MMGDLETAMSAILTAVEVARKYGDRASLTKAIGNQATYLFERGKIDEATPLFDEAETLARELKDNVLLSELLNNRVSVVGHNDARKALFLLAEVERLGRESGNMDALSVCLGNQGNALLQLGALDAALTKFQHQERLSREVGSMDGLQNALSRQALIFASRNDGDGALKLLEQQTIICRRICDKKALA
jgi:tetratricopeptide (TPR) repeat protein